MTRHTGAEAVELLRKLDHYDLARRLQHYVNEINRERAELREHADAAEARERTLREAVALSCEHRASAEAWLNNWRSADVLRDQADTIRRFVKPGDFPEHLAQQPADQGAQQRNWMNDEVSAAEDAVAKAPMWERTTCKPLSDQPAQGKRLDPYTLERAAHVVLDQGFRTSPGEKARAIRNLRGDQ